MAKKKITIEFGKCPFCRKEILTTQKIGNVTEPKILKGYSTFWVRLSDATKMKVAICEDCKEKLDEKKASDVVVAHRDYWKLGIEAAHEKKIKQLEEEKKQQLNYYSNLSLVKLGLREKDLE